MSDIQDLSTIRLAIKAQSGLGVEATGGSGYQIEVLPSGGLQAQIATIESNMIRQSRMKKRPRHGMESVAASYETELVVGALDPVFEGVLGGTWAVAQTFTEADFTSVTISGTGTIATFGSGSLLTSGLVAGMMVKFTNLATSANADVWVPVLAVTTSTLTFPSGYLVDETIDSAFSMTRARYLKTATPYTDRYFSLDEYWADADLSKFGADMRPNSLNISVAPNEYVKIGWGYAGRTLAIKDTGSSPVLTSPTLVTADSLILLDGGIYVNGTKRTDLTGLTCGLAAPANGVAVIGTNTSPDIFLGQFSFTGQYTGVVADGTDFALFDAETNISQFLHCKEQSTQNFVSFYSGRLSYGGYGTPAGGEGATIQTIPLYGGEDDRGAGYAATTFLISTSA